MTSQPRPSSRPRARSPSSSRSPARPQKRRRRTWADVVEDLALANGVEDDAHRIAQRQKQIDYGKNTLAYDKLAAVLPRHKRQKGDPMTPIAKQKCSKRSFMGQVTSWKKKVYDFAAALEEVREENKTKEGGVDNNGKEGGNENDGEVTAETSEKLSNGAKGDARSDEPSDTVGTAGEEDLDFSDMEDIELDDQGNLIPTESTPLPSKQAEQLGGKGKLEESPPSIFDVY